MPEKILIVEDEPTLQETLAYNLTRQGYEVITVSDGKSAIATALDRKPDLIVLDVLLPGLDGFEVCRIIRQDMNTPILILTALDDEIDRVIGLEMGADDYISKPFSMREFLARVKAHLRRVRMLREDMTVESALANEIFSFGNLTIDLTRRELLIDHRPVGLKPKEFDLLLFLARHPGQVLSRELILERVWGWEFGGGSRTVDVHIRWLREKIEADPTSPTRIITVRGVGYRFER